MLGTIAVSWRAPQALLGRRKPHDDRLSREPRLVAKDARDRIAVSR
jgi:hypothetical protein